MTDPTTEQKSDAVVSRAASVKLDAVTDQLFGGEADSALTVGAAASRLGITVRTLHHWDAIGLVCPSGRSDGGYRLYTDADLGRIGRVLVYRDVGLSLDEIGILLESPAAHVDETLRGQRAELRQRIADLEQRGESLDRIIDARKFGVLLPADEQVSIFGRHWQPSWGPEAHERWGDSAQWAQHAERSA
ncbi:MAG: MerR family transcriptional regulator, partial [Rhodococcus erythropolis]|nr:MerR family transcriptional regulator [Rhodococcus erythropolis]